MGGSWYGMSQVWTLLSPSNRPSLRDGQREKLCWNIKKLGKFEWFEGEQGTTKVRDKWLKNLKQLLRKGIRKVNTDMVKIKSLMQHCWRLHRPIGTSMLKDWGSNKYILFTLVWKNQKCQIWKMIVRLLTLNHLEQWFYKLISIKNVLKAKIPWSTCWLETLDHTYMNG